jgi:hypothetical protein
MKRIEDDEVFAGVVMVAILAIACLTIAVAYINGWR